MASAARRRFARNFLRWPQSYPARIINLSFRREAEQRKAGWRYASHRTPKNAKMADLTRIEVHGSAAELEKLKSRSRTLILRGSRSSVHSKTISRSSRNPQ